MPPDSVSRQIDRIYASIVAIKRFITGMMSPNPIESINIVMKIKPIAAERDFAINRNLC